MTFLGRLSAAILASVFALALQAQTPTVQEPSANDLQEFTRLLSDARIQDWLKAQVDGSGIETDTGPSARDQFEEVVEKTKSRIGALGQAWSNLGNVPLVITERWTQQLTPAVQVRSLTFVLIFLFFGAGLEWLVRQYTRNVQRRIEMATYRTTRQRLNAGLYRSGLAFLGLFVFSLGSIGAFSAFSWPPLLNVLILSLIHISEPTRPY